MGGNYQKDLYKQLMEVMARVDGLESEQKQDKKEIKRLTGEVTSLRKENATLREEVSSLKQENAILTERCGKLEKENTLLRNDNERMKAQNQPTHITAEKRLPGNRGHRRDIWEPSWQKRM